MIKYIFVEKRLPFREELLIILSRRIIPFWLYHVFRLYISSSFSSRSSSLFRFVFVVNHQNMLATAFWVTENHNASKDDDAGVMTSRVLSLCYSKELHIILFRCYLLQEALEVLRTTPSTVELVVCRLPGDSNVTPPGAPPPPPARREPPPPLRLLNPLPPLQIEPCGVSNAPLKHFMNIYSCRTIVSE